jgi:hypothetical protein
LLLGKSESRIHYAALYSSSLSCASAPLIPLSTPVMLSMLLIHARRGTRWCTTLLDALQLRCHDVLTRMFVTLTPPKPTIPSTYSTCCCHIRLSSLPHSTMSAIRRRLVDRSSPSTLRQLTTLIVRHLCVVTTHSCCACCFFASFWSLTISLLVFVVGTDLIRSLRHIVLSLLSHQTVGRLGYTSLTVLCF